MFSETKTWVKNYRAVNLKYSMSCFHFFLSLLFNRFEFSVGFTSGDNKTKASAIVLCSLYKSMHILQFKDNFEIEIAKFMHAYHNGKISNNFDDSFISAKNSTIMALGQLQKITFMCQERNYKIVILH